ncbi:hypothetical protein BJY00DRAFT_314952 [Aspergillus carlsbadensis]|nr:hypothetical protein BJY00DRAFT_314952 [Aspergillus carlsbadensis]
MLDKRVNWLTDEDMLPAVLPQARICVFEWDAGFPVGDPKERLIYQASLLVDSMKAELGSDADCPIVFIGSNFGGLIIAQALVRAHEEPASYGWILRSLAGVLFLGTPFRGVELIKVNRALVVMRRVATGGESLDALRFLQKLADEQVGEETTREFTRLTRMDSLCIDTHCFSETMPTRMHNARHRLDMARILPGSSAKFIVPKRSAFLDTGDSTWFAVPHHEMNKFRGPDCPNFRRIAAAVAKYAQDAPAVFEFRRTYPDTRHWLVPYGRNGDFIGRETELHDLLRGIRPRACRQACRRTILTGAPGVGKTEVALEVAFRFAAENPDCSVFWLCAKTSTSIRNSLRELARVLEISDTRQEGLTERVMDHLNRDSLGCWLLIIDGADDLQLLLDPRSKGLDYSLPRCPTGSILITTRNPVIKGHFTNADPTVVIELGNPEPLQVATWARKYFPDTPQAVQLMVEELPFRSAFAIKSLIYLISLDVIRGRYLPSQPDHYGDMTQIRHRVRSVSHSGNTGAARDDEDIMKNIVELAFQSLHARSRTFLTYLCVMCETEVPQSLFQRDDPFDKMAAEELKQASFIRPRSNDTSFDVAPGVRSAVRRVWEPRSVLDAPETSIIEHLISILPPPTAENRDTWLRYQPHVQEVLKSRKRWTGLDTVATLTSLLAQSYIEFGTE